MKLQGSMAQARVDYLYDASGTVTTGGTPQLILGRSISRSYLFIQNISALPMYIESGAGRATCTISNGQVQSSITVTNAGFGFKAPPVIEFVGGGIPAPQYTNYAGLAQPNAPTPGHPAQATANLSGGAIASITLNDPGSGYVLAPYLFLRSAFIDPFGCSVPSASSGRLLAAGESWEFNGTCCPTEAFAVFGATTAQAYTCKWMD